MFVSSRMSHACIKQYELALGFQCHHLGPCCTPAMHTKVASCPYSNVTADVISLQGGNCPQEHPLLDDEDDSDYPDGDNAQGPAESSNQSPNSQSAASTGGLGLQVQWRWSQESHPDQGVTCMAWNQVSSRRLIPFAYNIREHAKLPTTSSALSVTHTGRECSCTLLHSTTATSNLNPDGDLCARAIWLPCAPFAKPIRTTARG